MNLAGWANLRWCFFYHVHDIQRLFFLGPLLYACYFIGLKAMMLVSMSSLIVILPRAIFISQFHDAIFRTIVFTIISGLLGWFIYKIIGRNKIRQYASVRAVIRNEGNGLVGIQEKIEDGASVLAPLEIDLYKRWVKRNGQIVKLTPIEYKLFAYMVSKSEQAVPSKELILHVWGPEYLQESEYLRNFISQLRRKIEKDPSNPQFILTETGFGYRFSYLEGMPNNHPPKNYSQD